MENENNPGIEVTGNQVDAGTTEKEPVTGPSKPERTFTRNEVNDIMRKRVERSHNAFFNRYGVKDLNELDNLVGQSRSYGPLKERFADLEKTHGELVTSHADLNKKYAYKVNNVDENRIADIEAYFKGKGIDIDENTLVQELKTHPEWVKKIGAITSIGAESTPSLEKDEVAEAEKIFGVNFRRKR